MTGPRFLKLDDVCEELSISMSQARALVRSGDLVAIQVGGRGYLKFLSRFVESTCS
ncbi:helix-turn-helix domain-containing protein [Arthrobacter sp. Soil782]|uniref:helix-turn-helix transcriptional regulator n=1 Tax=Arthrobacter sp. Soil782 TaxID=1736410 RepID=UPI00138F006B